MLYKGCDRYITNMKNRFLVSRTNYPRMLKNYLIQNIKDCDRKTPMQSVKCNIGHGCSLTQCRAFLNQISISDVIFYRECLI